MSDREIRISEYDLNFKFEVAAAHQSARDLNACLSCGTCTAGCPIHRVYPEYDPRKIVRMIQYGLKQELLSQEYIWNCTTCHTCEQRCPQKVNFFNILNVLKNMAAKEGYMASFLVIQTGNLRQTGIVFPTEETWVKKREELSLRPLKAENERAGKIISVAGLDTLEPGRGRS
ncbi:MAG: 4Fe-4S dicluster domain-containing protein [bacterium]